MKQTPAASLSRTRFLFPIGLEEIRKGGGSERTKEREKERTGKLKQNKGKRKEKVRERRKF